MLIKDIIKLVSTIDNKKSPDDIEKMLKRLKSPCICTTFFRFNIFDEKVKNVKILDLFSKKMSPCAGDTTLLYVLYSSILGRVKLLKKINAF